MLTVLPVVALALLQSKLIAIDMVLGSGPEARKGDIVTVDYRGTLQTGALFDESKGKAPFTFNLGAGQVIKGWEEGVVGMKRGGKRILSIPPELGYGDRAFASIPADSTLIFEIEVLRVEKADAKIAIELVETIEGTGDPVKAGDKIEVHYTGKFLNGTKFDSSLDRGKPLGVEVGVTGIIKGFEQGLIGMKLGGKRTVTIPYQLAYGEKGRPPTIPERSTLVFELELVSIKPKS